MKESLYLGICAYGHDSAAAIMNDSQIIAAAEEERFTRIKHDGSFPENAVRFCLSRSGIKSTDIEYITFYHDPWLHAGKRIIHGIKYIPYSLRFFRAHKEHVGGWLSMFQVKKKLKSLGLGNSKLIFVEHHLSHASTCFFLSPFEKAAIFSCDGMGEWATTLMAVGAGNDLIKLKEIYFPHSLGILYEAITQYLGFRIRRDEYKVMALAGYGEPEFYEEFQKMINVDEKKGEFKLNLDFFDFHRGGEIYINGNFMKRFGSKRVPPEQLIERHFNIAASLQKLIEESVMKLLKFLKKESGLNKLCLCGGLALNCRLNGKILAGSPFDDVFVQAPPHDSGCAIGNMLFQKYKLLKKPRNHPFVSNGNGFSLYLGPEYSNMEIETALKSLPVNFMKFISPDERISKTAGLLARGKIIGWFQGKMEFGPRALGNRSILSDPRNNSLIFRINHGIKGRETWQPFAPAVILDDASEFFYPCPLSPYMLYTVRVKEGKKQFIPAVVHEDETSRIQTISGKDNPLFFDLLKSFKQKTGIPMLLNTSLNMKDEPIAMCPEHAIKILMNSDLDYLVIGDFISWKKQSEIPDIRLHEN